MRMKRDNNYFRIFLKLNLILSIKFVFFFVIFQITFLKFHLNLNKLLKLLKLLFSYFNFLNLFRMYLDITNKRDFI